jgi:hypothetical protein
MIHPPSLILGGLIVAALAVSGQTIAAQQETPTAAETATVTIGSYTFPELDTRQPVLALPVSRTTNGEGSFVSFYLAVQDARGEFHGASSCDDLVTPCLPFTSLAKAGLARADAGDAIPLVGDGS